MQAWLFYDNQDFWKPPQIQASNSLSLTPPLLFMLVKKHALHVKVLPLMPQLLLGKLTGSMPLSDGHMSAYSHSQGLDFAG